jgi:hypothetical protein
MTVLHSVRGISCLLALACAAAQATADDADAGPPRLEVETVPVWDAARRGHPPGWRTMDGAAASSQRLLPGLATQRIFGDDGLRARWWWGRGALEVGAGADWRAPSAAASAAQPWSQVLGVRATLSPRTRLVYETETVLPGGRADSAKPRTSRVALEFKSRKSPVSNLRDGLMRVQLSGDSAVHFKPRGGGLQVMYRERF